LFAKFPPLLHFGCSRAAFFGSMLPVTYTRYAVTISRVGVPPRRISCQAKRPYGGSLPCLTITRAAVSWLAQDHLCYSARLRRSVECVLIAMGHCHFGSRPSTFDTVFQAANRIVAVLILVRFL
jgi:hypothetical protein